MKKKYRLVVFDWEGTLSDTLGQVLHCVAAEADRLNFGKFDEKIARQSVELGLMAALKKVFSHLSEQQHTILLEAVQQALTLRSNEVYLMPHAREIITSLADAGINLAIATNKGSQSLHRALHITGLDAFFKTIRAAGQVPPKPCPQMLQEILEEVAVAPSEAVMIGDSLTDIEMATRLSVDAISMNFNYHAPELLYNAGALKVFNDFPSLANYLI